MATVRGVSCARVGRRCASARVGVSRASVVKSARARAVRAVKTRAAREGEEDSAAAAKTETETASYKTSVTDDPAFTDGVITGSTVDAAARVGAARAGAELFVSGRGRASG